LVKGCKTVKICGNRAILGDRAQSNCQLSSNSESEDVTEMKLSK